LKVIFEGFEGIALNTKMRSKHNAKWQIQYGGFNNCNCIM